MPKGDKTPQPDARLLALRRICARETSAAQLKSYLRRKGVSETEAAATVQAMLQSGELNDERYSRAMLRTQAARGKGPAYVAAKLAEKGVKCSSSDIRRVFEETTGQTEAALALKILERRLTNRPETPKEQQRAYQFLLRRGFSPDAIREALNAFGRPERERPT